MTFSENMFNVKIHWKIFERNLKKFFRIHESYFTKDKRSRKLASQLDIELNTSK